jgi:hypothetical protein
MANDSEPPQGPWTFEAPVLKEKGQSNSCQGEGQAKGFVQGQVKSPTANMN